MRRPFWFTESSFQVPSNREANYGRLKQRSSTRDSTSLRCHGRYLTSAPRSDGEPLDRLREGRHPALAGPLKSFIVTSNPRSVPHHRDLAKRTILTTEAVEKVGWYTRINK